MQVKVDSKANNAIRLLGLQTYLFSLPQDAREKGLAGEVAGKKQDQEPDCIDEVLAVEVYLAHVEVFRTISLGDQRLNTAAKPYSRRIDQYTVCRHCQTKADQVTLILEISPQKRDVNQPIGILEEVTQHNWQ